MAAGRIQGITIEIGGDTTKLSKAMSGANSEIASTNRSLKDLNKLLKLDPKNTTLLAQKQDVLKQKIQATEDKLKTLKQAESQLSKEELGKEKWDALQREIIATEADLKKLKSQVSIAKEIGAKFQEAGTKIKAAGGAVKDLGEALAPISAAFAAADTAAIKFATDLEDGLAKLQTIMDPSQMPMDAMEEQIKSLSNQYGVSTTEIAEGLYNIISATGDTAGSLELMEQVLRLTKAGFTDVSSATSVLTTIMNAYGYTAADAARINDSLIMVQNRGVTTVNQLAGSMGKLIATSSAYNVSLEDIEAAYISTTKQGIATAESTTYISSMLNELGDAGSDVSAILKEKTEKSFGELMNEGYSLGDVLGILYDSVDGNSEAFANMWGSAEAGKASIAIINQGLDYFDESLQQCRDGLDATSEAFETVSGTHTAQFNQSMQTLKNVLADLGATMLSVLQPAIDLIAEKIQQFSTWWDGLDEGMKKYIATMAMIAAVVAPVLVALGGLITFIGMIVSAVGVLIPIITAAIPVIAGVALPILGVVAAAVALVAVFYLVAKNFDKIKEAFLSTVSAAIQLGEILIDKVVGAFKALVNAVKIAITNMKNNVVSVFNAIKSSVIATVSAVKAKAVSTFGALVSGVVSKISSLKSKVTTAMNNVKNAIMNVVNGAKNWGRHLMENFINGIAAKFGALKNKVNQAANAVKNKLGHTKPKEGPLRNDDKWGEHFMDNLINGINRKLSEMERMSDKVANSLNFGMSDMGSNTQAGQTIIQSGNGDVVDAVNQMSMNMTNKIGGIVGAIEGMGVYMSSGAVVGEIKNEMDHALGNIAAQKGRR